MSSPRRPQPSAQLPSRLPAPPFQGVVCRWESAAKWNQWSVIERRPLHCPSCHPHHHPNVAAIRAHGQGSPHPWLEPHSHTRAGATPSHGSESQHSGYDERRQTEGHQSQWPATSCCTPLWDVILGRGTTWRGSKKPKEGPSCPFGDGSLGIRQDGNSMPSDRVKNGKWSSSHWLAQPKGLGVTFSALPP